PHPVTQERIADIENRLDRMPYRQVRDSIEFQLVRAKLRAELDTPQEARAFFEQSLAEKRYLSEAATRYGLAATLVRAKDYAGAKKQFEALRQAAGAHPMVETLGCRIRQAANEPAAALACYRDALRAYPKHRALVYEYSEGLLDTGRPEPALEVISGGLQQFSEDPKLYLLQARAYA